jgi:16S rRNA (guanine966-N2)-methyltransferase
MRIVAGVWRGRRIAAPKGQSTRPTTDRVREALFSSLASILGAGLGGGAVLDAFAGSGALGLEALSRGAASATFVDSDRPALGVLKANIAELGASRQARVMTGDVFALARKGALAGGPFSLLLLDPPYRLDAGQIASLVSELASRDLLEDGAIVVYEHESGRSVTWPDAVCAVAVKRYGTTEVDIARFERGQASR